MDTLEGFIKLYRTKLLSQRGCSEAENRKLKARSAQWSSLHRVMILDNQRLQRAERKSSRLVMFAVQITEETAASCVSIKNVLGHLFPNDVSI